MPPQRVVHSVIPPRTSPDYTFIYGYGLLAIAFLLFALPVYAIVLAPLLPPTQNMVLDAVRNDNYYKYLALSLIPLTWLTVFLNWSALKFFRTN